jgi:opacity protein-like surface antigen
MPKKMLPRLLVPTLLICAASAAAEELHSYVGAQAGMFLPIESLVSGERVAPDGKVTYHPGLVLSAVAGRQFGSGIRTEAEIDYRRLSSDRFINGGSTAKVASEIRNYGLMTNIYYDFRNRSAVTPYIGGGVGFAVTEFGRGSSNGAELWSDGRDVTIAYQGIGGFALRLSERSSLDFVYHHYAIPRLHFETLSAQFRGPNLSLGFRHWF